MSCFLDRLDSSQKPGHRCRCLRLPGYLEHVLPFGATWLWASIKLFQKFNGSFVCFYDILVMTFYDFMLFLESLWWGANAGGDCRLRFCPWMLIASLQLSLWFLSHILLQQFQHVRWMDATSCLAAERHCGRSAVTLAWASLVPPGKSGNFRCGAVKGSDIIDQN